MPTFGQDTYIRFWGMTAHVRGADFAEQVEAWQRYFLALGNRMVSLQPFLAWFGDYMVTGSIMRNFDAEGRPSWPRLSPRYAAWKEAHYPGRPILVLTGDMKAGFDYEATEQTLKILNEKWYWKVHNTGYPPNNLPARTIVMLQNADKTVFTRGLRKFVTTGEVGT